MASAIGALVLTSSLPATPINPPALSATKVNPIVVRSITDAQFVKTVEVHDYEAEVLKPLHGVQAEKARIAALEAAEAALAAQKAKDAAIVAERPQKASTQVVVNNNLSDPFTRLRMCESGGNYATNTGNGYYGAYQYDLKTWNNYGGYLYPSDAPPAVQDAKAQETQAARGWSPWPSCSAKLGLSGNS